MPVLNTYDRRQEDQHCIGPMGHELGLLTPGEKMKRLTSMHGKYCWYRISRSPSVSFSLPCWGVCVRSSQPTQCYQLMWESNYLSDTTQLMNGARDQKTQKTIGWNHWIKPKMFYFKNSWNIWTGDKMNRKCGDIKRKVQIYISNSTDIASKSPKKN